MELRHLRYFVAAAEAENVSRAALKLHVSQPALSRQIHDLEEELGFSLFERSARSVRLTGAGRAFLGEVREALQRVEQAVSTARAVASGPEGELYVGYAPSPTARILPRTLRAFRVQMPRVRVKLHDLSTDEMVAGVREGKLHLSFMVRPNRAMLRGLHFEAIARDMMCLAVPPGHALAGSRFVTTSQAAREPLVIFSRKDYPEYSEYLQSLFAPSGRTPVIAGEHDSSASLTAAVESGAGVAIVPESFACSAGPRLKLVPFRPKPQALIIGALWSDKRVSSAAELFLSCARQSAANK